MTNLPTAVVSRITTTSLQGFLLKNKASSSKTSVEWSAVIK
jgi:hypothetical protein